MNEASCTSPGSFLEGQGSDDFLLGLRGESVRQVVRMPKIAKLDEG